MYIIDFWIFSSYLFIVYRELVLLAGLWMNSGKPQTGLRFGWLFSLGCVFHDLTFYVVSVVWP